MPSASMTARIGSLATLSVIVTLSGCAPFNDWFRGRASEPEASVAGSGITGPYLMEMFALASGDPATQAEIHADAAAAAQLTPTTSSRLRYALVLAAPGHPGSDPEHAQYLLRNLLSEPELLTPVELSLATIHLSEVEERLTLNAEANRLRAENSRAANTEERAVAQRMADIETENRQLRQSLAEAEEKLEAITSIERSIREQSENDEQR